MLADTSMDLESIQSFMMNGNASKWTICKEVEVAITILRQDYVGHGIVIQAISCGPLLVEVSMLEVSEAIGIPIPYPIGDIQQIS